MTTRSWIAVGIAVLWGVGYLAAIIKSEAGLAAAATPVALVAVGYLLSGRREQAEPDA